MLASVILGLLAALGRLSLNPLAYGLSTFYTSFFRGTPLLLQVLLIYQGLPQLAQSQRQSRPALLRWRFAMVLI